MDRSAGPDPAGGDGSLRGDDGASDPRWRDDDVAASGSGGDPEQPVSAGRPERGWTRVAALALVTMVFSIVQPMLLIFVPLALLLIGLPPRPAPLVAFALVVLWIAFGQGLGDETLWYFERGWALMLGAWFVVMVVALPGRGFLARGLGTLFATSASAGVLLAATAGGWERLDHAVADQLRAGASGAVTAWSRVVGLDRVSEEMSRAVYAAAELQIRLYPALLGLASLAALGVAWWAFGRLARREAVPLRPVREFRFRDDLVWLLIAAVVLLALPLGALATRAGENLLTFMAVLYALRGAAVLLVIGGAPGPIGVILTALLVVFMYPLVMAAAFLVGLSDTWLDIRSRRQQPSAPGS
jgi:hypothetical protein